MFDILGVSLLTGLIVLFAWLAWRAWNAARPVFKWSGMVLSGLLTVLFVTALIAALVGYSKLNKKYDNPVPDILVEATPERLEKGARFAKLCTDCHAADESLPMEGRDFLGQDAPPIGTLYAPNLTPAHLSTWTDGEIIRAIREGIHKSGRSLLIMPSRAFRNLSDEDVQAIVAYLRSQPSVEPDTPPTRLNVLGAIMVNLAPVFEAQAPVKTPIVAPPEGATAEYGSYLASYSCAFCHGADLRGDVEFGAPDLAGFGRGWTEEQFLHFMHTGLRPGGTAVDGEAMPWKDLGEFFEDDELRAIYAHMGALGS